MNSLTDQLLHASAQVRRLRADGDSDKLLYWYKRRETLLDAMYAATHDVDQPV